MENSTQQIETNWKQKYQEFFSTMPKKFRKTKAQINHIRSQAKLYVTIYGGEMTEV